MADYRRDVIAELEANGCSFVRHGTGSHDVWQSPHTPRRFVVQHDLSSRIAANKIMKQAGLSHRF
ncbi:MAG: type II toxin-antitoxin system HicA family toxin [Croceibacterium sp.]